MKKTVLYPITLLFCGVLHMSIGLGASEPGIETKLQMIMGQTRINKPFDGISDAELQTVDPQLLLSLLEPYEKDPVWMVRRLAYLYEVRLARLQPRPEVRQEVVKRLIEGLITGRSKQATKWLLSFKAEDFSDATKEMIREALAQADIDKVGGAPSIWLCGVANMKDQLPRLKKLLINEVAYSSDPNMRHFPKWYYTSGWAARLARARIGVKEDIQKCIELVEKEAESNDRHFMLLHDIGYIRQPAAINYLRQYLESDKRLPSVRAGTPGEPVSNYVMSILAESLRNYPVKRKEARNYTEQEIDRCRKWMSQQTTWQIIR